MKHIITLICAILISCGGGSSSPLPTPDPDPVLPSTGVSGLSGSISDIEIIDVD